MTSHSRAVEVPLPEATLLADLYGIDHDLDAVQQLCETAIDISATQTGSYLVVEGLMWAAVSRYARCFTTGSRLSLKPIDLAEAGADVLKAHGYVISLRDRFIAHAVNPFEESYVTVTAREENGKLMPIKSIAPGYGRVLLSANDAQNMLNLVNEVRAVVKKRISSEETTLLLLIQNLPLEVVHSWDLHTAIHPGEEQVSHRRRRGVNAKKN